MQHSITYIVLVLTTPSLSMATHVSYTWFHHVYIGCDGYLQLVAVHEDEPLYLLPGEEFTYKCISDCVGPDEPRQEGFITFCDGEII